MIGIGTVITGDDVLTAQFGRAAVALQPAVNAVTKTYTMLLVASVQAHASGRPGPDIVTGAYRRSWTPQFITVDGTLAGEAGTSAPQANRLENGFAGVDALGRHYHQPPFPHVLPASLEIEPKYEAALLLTVEALL